ncbi:MAG: FecR domain-containing protein, partial [Gammaproteobacteria bacterium]|nr:FecR domain-containing protein [Gammaproteobacteria bacterium]
MNLASIVTKALKGFFFILMVAALPGQAQASDVAGRIVSLYGDVWVSSSPQNPWRKITGAENLYIGSTIKTGRLSGVNLRMEDESLIRLSQTSEFKIEGVRVSSFWRSATALVSGLTQGVESTYRLLTGKLWGRNNSKRLNSRVVTTTATIGIRGTEYSIEANEKFSSVTILEGVVLAENELGKTTIYSGEQAITRAGQAPQKSTIVQSAESVQWTVQVPELINLHPYLKRSLGNQDTASQIIHSYQLSQFANAQDLLKKALEKQPDSVDLNIVNAWLNIKAGESQTAYRQLSVLNSNDGALQEMKAFSAFLVGNIDEANKIINQLKGQSSLSDTGWVVSGYLAQANYDLPSAEKAYVKALESNADNQLARVQLATIYFGSEQEQRALNLVNTSLRARPDFLPAINLKAFIHLSQNETSTAIKIWEEAESKGSANAETYFGLSLGYMRKGKIEQAMQSIATAVLLDPQRSMYLSYWGKMLNQIGRNDKALTVLDSA